MSFLIARLYVRSRPIGLPTCAAPNRSARAVTTRSRISVASSSVSVLSGAWNARWIATDLRPLHLIAAVDVEDARLAQKFAGGVVRGVDERADLDVLGDRDRDVLQGGRKVMTSS